MIKGLFFDVGGTLYSYGSMGQSIMALLGEFSERHELEHDLEDLWAHYRSASIDADHHFADQAFYLFRHYFETIHAKFLQRMELEHDQHHNSWFVERKNKLLAGNLQLKSDCHEVLTKLKDTGIYMAVVSNSDDDMLRELLQRGDLLKYMDHWTSSEAAQSCKPDGKIFQICLEKAQLNAEEILFVGDSLEQDIQGAHDAGMKTVLISETDAEAPMHTGRETVEPDYRITDLSELISIVNRLIQ